MKEKKKTKKKVRIEGASMKDWTPISDPPKVGSEYNVVWNLDDNDYPTVTTMFYDMKTNKWTDCMNDGTEDMTKKLLYWRELPIAPKGIPKHIWHTEGIKPLVTECEGAKCQIRNCPVCNNEMY